MDKESKSLKFRRDWRTNEQFKKDIQNTTKKEKFLLELFVKHYKNKGISVTYQNNGVNNDGKFVKESNCNADYSITIDGKSALYEIKNSPVNHKITFKVYNLTEYVIQQANILLFYGTGNINTELNQIDLNNTYWAIIYYNKIEQMLKDYPPYNEWMFGNKKCIQIQSKDFHKYFTSEKLEV